MDKDKEKAALRPISNPSTRDMYPYKAGYVPPPNLAIHIHTCIYIYIHTHTYIHTHIHQRESEQILQDLDVGHTLTCMDTYIHAYMPLVLGVDSAVKPRFLYQQIF